MKISLRTQLAYGIGQAPDTITYCMFYVFFLWFLTDYAMISPTVAGAISLLAVCWDAVTDPIIGYLTDRSKSKYGRRRPFMIASVIPLGVVVFMLFGPLDVGPAYYLAFAILLWTFYTLYLIPYVSLGADLSPDYNQRTLVRMFNMIFGGFFMLLCLSGPMWVVDLSLNAGLDDRTGWAISGAVFGGLLAICGVISWNALRGKEIMVEQDDTEKIQGNLMTIIKEAFCIRAFRIILGMTFFAILGLVLASTIIVYLLNYNVQLSESEQAVYWIIYSLFYIIMVPVISVLANKVNKKRAFIFANAVAAVSMLLFFFIGIDSWTVLIAYSFFLVFAEVSFFTLYMAFAYDIAEIDEYKNGTRREGFLVSIVSFMQKFGAAIGMFACGVLLDFVSYDAELVEQPTSVLTGISAIATLSLVVFCVVGILIMLRYPVTKQKYDALVNAVQEKKEGKTVDESAFSDIL